MNKSKLVLPVVSLFLLTGCGPKTKTVKEIWGNTWGYVNSSAVVYNIERRQQLEAGEVNWEETHISCPGHADEYFKTSEQNKENLLGSEFIRTSNYLIFKDNRDFFAKNKIVVSTKEEGKVKVGDTEYKDAVEKSFGYDIKGVAFNEDQSSLQPDGYDSEGYIDELIADITYTDGKRYCNKFTYYITLTNGEEFAGTAYLELPCLA